MNVRELHAILTDMLHDGYGDCECIVGSKLGGKSVETRHRCATGTAAIASALNSTPST